MGRLREDEGFEREQGFEVFLSLYGGIEVGIADPFDSGVDEGTGLVMAAAAEEIVACGGGEVEELRHVFQFQKCSQKVFVNCHNGYPFQKGYFTLWCFIWFLISL